MNKLLIVSFVSLAACVGHSAVKAPKPEPTIAERKAAKAARLRAENEQEGGSVIRPGTMKGWILFGNAQSAVDPFILEEVRDDLWLALNFDIRVQTCAPVTPATVSDALAKSGANAAVYLVSDPDAPLLLVAPEDRWGIVNVARLAKDAKTQKYVEKRVAKELMRAFAHVCGGAGSSYSGDTLVGAIRKPADLDRIAEVEYPVDVLMRFSAYLKRWGVTSAECAQYSSAVYEDWCPAPTNAVQKRLWDEAHALPTNPIKIRRESERK